MPDDQNDGIISPGLIDSAKRLSPDRRVLILAIILPYMFLCACVLYGIIFTEIDQARLTLAASTILAPLGTLAGGIVAYYFKSS